MARIRTIKPEFWTDDLLGSLTRDDRLLFIATWNLADDEGLLRWTAPFLKGAVFPFDDDVGISEVEGSMARLTEAGVVFPYQGGRSQQKLAYVVNFQKHQKINRPSPSKLPPPPLQDPRVRDMYGARDGFVCHLCKGKIDEAYTRHNEDFLVSVDHINPVSHGGNDYPSNIKAAHATCNKGRGNRTPEQYREVLKAGKTNAQFRNPERFTHLHCDDGSDPFREIAGDGSLNNSVNWPVTEGEGEREQGRGPTEASASVDDDCAGEPEQSEEPEAKAFRMPREFRLSEEDRDFARSAGWSDSEVDDGEAEFVDYWSNPKLPASKALKINWSAVWRNRVRDLGKRRGTPSRLASSTPANGFRYAQEDRSAGAAGRRLLEQSLALDERERRAVQPMLQIGRH